MKCNLISSLMTNSQVGIIQIKSSLFINYGQSCLTICSQNRYLKCNDHFLCDCIEHTYWNSSSRMCLSQMTISGSFCSPNMNMCRNDLNLTCSFNNQCIG